MGTVLVNIFMCNKGIVFIFLINKSLLTFILNKPWLLIFRPMTVKMQFYNKMRNMQRKLQRSQEREEKHVKTLHKLRISKSKLGTRHKTPTPGPERHVDVTPRKAAGAILARNKLAKSKHRQLYKDLTAYKCLVLKVAKAPKKARIALLSSTEKNTSRSATRLASQVSLHRTSVLTKRRHTQAKRQILQREKARVIEFLTSQPNSNPLPGKKDVSASGVQKFTLNDTMSNLYSRFKEKNPLSRISLTTFCRQRPPNVKTITWSERRQCLCMLHENGRLLLKAVKFQPSVSRFLEKSEEEVHESVLAVPNDVISYRQWVKEDISYDGGVIKKLRLKELQDAKANFVEMFDGKFQELRQHVGRVTNQYQHLNLLKEKMPPKTEITCQMDYSENFACTHQDEISQAFYDRNQISIHPMVVHYKEDEGRLQHQSYVGISEVKSHTAPTTFAFLRKLVPLVKDLLPQIEIIHYITDSPTSQYRNKSVVKIVANHAVFFPSVTCTWDYLESGHGKGPCDGVGGAIKRYAENAVKKGHLISNAVEFYNWALESNEKMKFVYVSKQEVDQAERSLRNAELVKGVSKCHTMRPFAGHIYLRDMSCYSECCQESLNCPGWEKTQVKVAQIEDAVQENASEEPEAEVEVAEQNLAQQPEKELKRYEVGSIVDATYKGKEYRGQILQFDEETDEYELKFMKQATSGVYIWGKNSWSSWIAAEHIKEVMESQKQPTSTDQVESNADAHPEIYEVGSLVDVLYNGKEYRGEIMQYYDEFKDYEVKFMKKTQGGGYIWARNTWSSCIPASDVLGLVQSP